MCEELEQRGTLPRFAEILAQAEALGGERDSLIEFAAEGSPDGEQDRGAQREDARRHGPGEVDRLRAIGERVVPAPFEIGRNAEALQ